MERVPRFTTGRHAPTVIRPCDCQGGLPRAHQQQPRHGSSLLSNLASSENGCHKNLPFKTTVQEAGTGCRQRPTGCAPWNPSIIFDGCLPLRSLGRGSAIVPGCPLAAALLLVARPLTALGNRRRQHRGGGKTSARRHQRRSVSPMVLREPDLGSLAEACGVPGAAG